MALGPKLMRPMPMLMRGRFGRLGRCAAFLTSCAASRSRAAAHLRQRGLLTSDETLRLVPGARVLPDARQASLSRFASTGISFALSASEMSMRLSTSRATERSAVRLLSMVPSVRARRRRRRCPRFGVASSRKFRRVGCRCGQVRRGECRRTEARSCRLVPWTRESRRASPRGVGRLARSA